MSSADSITCFTVHPVGFDLTQPGLRLDHTKGYYWSTEFEHHQRYRAILERLHQTLGTTQILWTIPRLGLFRADPSKCVWQIEVPSEFGIAYDSGIWEHLLDGGTDDWSGLFRPPENNVHYLLRFPLPAGAIVRMGVPNTTNHHPLTLDHFGPRLRK